MNSLSNLESVNYSANAEIDKIGSAIGNSLSQIAEGEQMGFFERLFKGNNDVIGINGAEVPNIKAALTTYVNSINDKLKEINASVSTENAFRGKYAEATRQFVKSISAACTALTSQLLNFNDELDRVKATFEAKSLSMATNINIVSDDINKAAGGQAASSTSTEQKSTQNVSAPANSGVSASMANPNSNVILKSKTAETPVVTPPSASTTTPENKVGVTPFALPSLFSGFNALADNGASNNNSNNDHSNFKQQMVDDQVNNKAKDNESKDIIVEKKEPKTEPVETPAIKTAAPSAEVEKPVVRAKVQSEEVETPATPSTSTTSTKVGKDMDIPSGSTYPKAMESYHQLDIPNTVQYQITHGGTWNGVKYTTRTDPETSIRITNVDGEDYYLAAMGTYYGECGDKFKIKTDTGKEFNVMLGDVKGSDSGTYHESGGDSGTYYHDYDGRSKCVVELIYDPSALPEVMKVYDNGKYRGVTGTFSTLPQFSGNVISVEKLK